MRLMQKAMWALMAVTFYALIHVWVSAAGDQINAADELLSADRRFAAETAKRGLDGWMSFLADDAARLDLGGKAARGLDDIRKRDSSIFADSSIRLIWDPTDAGLFKDGNHGFTTGRYQLIKTGSPPDTLSTGGYVSIWRRDDGKWKVILDTGAADPQ